MVRQPLVNFVCQTASIRTIESKRLKTLLVVGQDIDEPCMFPLALIGDWASALVHAPFLETDVMSKVLIQ